MLPDSVRGALFQVTLPQALAASLNVQGSVTPFAVVRNSQDSVIAMEFAGFGERSLNIPFAFPAGTYKVSLGSNPPGAIGVLATGLATGAVFPTDCQVPVYIIPGGSITRSFTVFDCDENGFKFQYYQLTLSPGQSGTVTATGSTFPLRILPLDYLTGVPVQPSGFSLIGNTVQFTLNAPNNKKMSAYVLEVSPITAGTLGAYALAVR